MCSSPSGAHLARAGCRVSASVDMPAMPYLQPTAIAKPEPKGPDLLTGRSAFQKVYIAARGWAPDAKPYRIVSVPTSDANGHDGKWAAWRASFASPSQHAVKSYVWSGSTAPDA